LKWQHRGQKWSVTYTAAGFVAIVPAVVNPIIAICSFHTPSIVASELGRTACYNVSIIIIIISSSSSVKMEIVIVAKVRAVGMLQRLHFVINKSRVNKTKYETVTYNEIKV